MRKIKDIVSAICLFFLFLNPALAQTTAAILPQGKTQFLDNNGNPLSSGKVYFYIPSTTTFKTTWQDAAKTTPNTNPVILDAGGRAIIYGDGTYRQLVRTSANVTIYDAVTASAGSGGSTTGTGDGDLVATVKPWAGLVAPNQYVFAYGQEISRTTFSVFFTAITLNQNINCSSGSPILTGLSDTSQINTGAVIEATCVAAGTRVLSKTTTTVTLNNNASLTTATTAVFFPFGNGNGSTTFQVPDLRGYVIAGRDNMGGTAANRLTVAGLGQTASAIGAAGGVSTQTLITSNLPPYVPIGTVTGVVATGTVSTPTITMSASANSVVNSGTGSSANLTGGGGALNQAAVTATSSTPIFSGTGGTANFNGTAQGGTSTPFSNVQSTQTLNYIIKIVPDSNSADASGVTSIQGMTGDIACGSGLLCTGNIISVTGLGGFTQNSIPFANALGQLTQNNTNLGWNDTSGQMYIGTPPLGGILNIKGFNNDSNVIYAEGQGSAGALSALPITITLVDFSTGHSALIDFRAVNSAGTIIGQAAGLNPGFIWWDANHEQTDWDFNGYRNGVFEGMLQLSTGCDSAFNNNGNGPACPVSQEPQLAPGNTTAVYNLGGIQGGGGGQRWKTLYATGADITGNGSQIILGTSVNVNEPKFRLQNSAGGNIGIITGNTNTSGMNYDAASHTFLSGGIVVSTATGGSQGPGTVNVSSGYYINGVLQAASTPAALTRTNDTNVTVTLGGTPATALLQATSLTLGWSGQLAVSRGGTGLASGTSGGIPYFNSTTTMASSALLGANQIVIGGGAGAAPSTFACATTTTVVHGGTPPTCSQIVAADITTNTVSNANLAQVGAATLKGNPTNATANATDFTIQGLTARGAPDATNDKIPIYDNAAGTIKYVTPGQVASSATSGVSSLNALTGALTWSITTQSFCSSGCTTTIAGGGTGTYTPTAGTVYAELSCSGAGGGGGGAAASATGISGGGGGGSGSIGRGVFSAATIGASQTVSIGTLGTAGAAGNNAGGAGGDSSFGTLVISKGGAGGGGAATISSGVGGAGGTAATGNLSIGATGEGGINGYGASVITALYPAGKGGSNMYGGGGIPINGTGPAGTGHGAGGAGGVSYSSAVDFAGGAGTTGICFAKDYKIN